MVFRGQFLERPTLIPVGAEVLEGLWHRGERAPSVLILPPPPEEGGSMDHLAANEIAWACTVAGHPTLRFNFRGVGASQGERGSGKSLVDDAAAALRVLEDNVPALAPAALIGLGGASEVALALAAFGRRVSGVCLVAPPRFDPKLRPAFPFRAITALDCEAPPEKGLAGIASRNLPQLGKAVVRWLETLPREAESL